MARMSDAIRGVMGLLGRAGSLASHLHTAGSLLGALKGTDLPTDAGDAVKGLHGVLGLGDERELQILLIQLEEADAGSRTLIEEFIDWHFTSAALNAQTKLAKAYVWRAGNNFRSFITKMGSAPHRSDPEKFRVETYEETTLKRSKTVTKTTAPIEGRGSNNSLEFLKWMAKTIKSETSREDGFRKLLKALQVGHIPHVSENVLNMLDSIGPKTKSIGHNLKNEIDQAATTLEPNLKRRQTRPKGLLWRLIINWKL